MAPEIKALDAETIPMLWRVPAELRRIRGLRGEPKLAYILLWQCAGCQAARLSIDYFALRDAMGGSERGVRRWLQALHDCRLIEILRRGPRSADIRVRDWRKAGPFLQRKATPAANGSQLALPGWEDEPQPAIPIWQHFTRKRSGNGEPPKAG